MRHGVAGRKLGRPTDQRLALFRSLVTELFRYDKITTTLPKAKAIQSEAEKFVTLAKRGDLHARRQALAYIYDPKIVDKLFAVIGPKYADRQGGYTRIVKLGPRQGDAAPMARIELVE
ncbi:MAG: 50S ribosomal protein L17 [Chloroflexi bacterium]|nr:50S ribosomal protein L17 [Chloroflexota bacterium]MDA8188540.1 50S ribosomal protein L17 [Dehalococcoidales bacterium]